MKLVAFLVTLAVVTALTSLNAMSEAPLTAAAAVGPPNVVILLSDDQRWDKITPTYTPKIWDQLVDSPGTAAHPNATGTAFQNSFVSNPLCCPSRATILSGEYSHTNGVWNNEAPYGGFDAFNDKHTLAVDFQAAGYRTAMIGKYLNGYRAGTNTYIPPGWNRWFATSTGDYFNYSVTTRRGFRSYGSEPRDYMTRVLRRQALSFIDGTTTPFFLYLSFTAPHGPATPDPLDVGRFAGEPDFHFTDRLQGHTSSMLEAAYGVDRAFGKVLTALPENTIVLYLSDNGFMWEDDSIHGPLSRKVWPYNESVRVPMIFASLDGTVTPAADPNDIVANVDIRTSLLHAAGLAPLTSQEGINWFDVGYSARDHLLLEHYGKRIYCGLRSKAWLYVRFHEDNGTYSQELYDESADPHEMSNLADDPLYSSTRLELRALATTECDPPPPGFSW